MSQETCIVKVCALVKDEFRSTRNGRLACDAELFWPATNARLRWGYETEGIKRAIRAMDPRPRSIFSTGRAPERRRLKRQRKYPSRVCKSSIRSLPSPGMAPKRPRLAEFEPTMPFGTKRQTEKHSPARLPIPARSGSYRPKYQKLNLHKIGVRYKLGTTPVFSLCALFDKLI
jgi:hypothetical protein